MAVLDGFALLGRVVVLAKAFSYIAGYGFRLLPAFQFIQQLIPLYGEHMVEDRMPNCEVRVTLRPGGSVKPEKSLRNWGPTPSALGRERLAHGSGCASVSESDQRRPLMLAQKIKRLPEEDLIVFRRDIFPTYGKKVRYYAEKDLLGRTKIPAPAMPRIVIDPVIAANSLRVIDASAGACNTNTVSACLETLPSGPVSWTGSRGSAHCFNKSAIVAAKAVPPNERTKVLFEQLLDVMEAQPA